MRAAVALVAMMLAGCQLVDAQPEPPRTLAVVAIVDGYITATTPEPDQNLVPKLEWLTSSR